MQIRMKYEKGYPYVFIIKEPEDRFVDMKEAIDACVVQLYEAAEIFSDAEGDE